jgi:predicted heme/steroid binding protein/uncharacterized membrane protein
MKAFTKDDLSKEDGRQGAGTLVAVDGRVFDLSSSEKWKDGLHMNRHRAGGDLGKELSAAPHGAEMLERFEQVGEYLRPPEKTIPGVKGRVDSWLRRHPFFRRHPHPAAVHVPVGVMIVVPLFEIIAILTGSRATEWAAYCCLIVVMFALPPSMATGYFTWWMNYDGADQPTISRKKHLAWFALLLAIATVILRACIDRPLDLSDPRTWLYLCALLVLTLVVSVIGFLGGNLTFPYE